MTYRCLMSGRFHGNYIDGNKPNPNPNRKTYLLLYKYIVNYIIIIIVQFTPVIPVYQKASVRTVLPYNRLRSFCLFMILVGAGSAMVGRPLDRRCVHHKPILVLRLVLVVYSVVFNILTKHQKLPSIYKKKHMGVLSGYPVLFSVTFPLLFPHCRVRPVGPSQT